MTVVLSLATRLTSIRRSNPALISHPPTTAALTLAAALLLTLFAPAAAAMMHPQMGRFLQRDPVGYVDGLNQYAGYHIVSGGVDPSGRSLIIITTPPAVLTPRPVIPIPLPRSIPIPRPNVVPRPVNPPFPPIVFPKSDAWPDAEAPDQGEPWDTQNWREINNDEIQKIKDSGCDPHDMKRGPGPDSNKDIWIHRRTGDLRVLPKEGPGKGGPGEYIGRLQDYLEANPPVIPPCLECDDSDDDSYLPRWLDNVLRYLNNGPRQPPPWIDDWIEA
ncbi:MAG: polymorphic toxin type 33 domain-containing protein [Planctomycetota bacterium]